MNRFCLRFCFFINDQYHANSLKCFRADIRVTMWRFCFYQTTSNTLKMVMDSVPEASRKLHIRTRLSVRENMIEFCRRESFKTHVYWTVYLLDTWIKRDQIDVTCLIISLFNASMQAEALVPQPAYGYHTTTAKPQRNTNTHRTKAIQLMK